MPINELNVTEVMGFFFFFFLYVYLYSIFIRDGQLNSFE